MSDTDIKIVGYCRTCGTGLDEANVRNSNGTIYCAEHLPPFIAEINRELRGQGARKELRKGEPMQILLF